MARVFQIRTSHDGTIAIATSKKRAYEIIAEYLEIKENDPNYKIETTKGDQTKGEKIEFDYKDFNYRNFCSEKYPEIVEYCESMNSSKPAVSVMPFILNSF